MAILKDLIVHGSSRFLNKIYANEIQAEEGIFSKLIAKNADITDLTVYGLLDSRGQLHTKTWTNSNIATIDGSFYITPTLNSASGTFSFLNSTSTNARFIGDFSVMNSSSMYLGGKSPTTSSWTEDSKVLITGQVKVNNEWIPLGNVVADISSVNSTTLDIKNIRTTINGNTAPSTTSMIYFVKPNQTLSYRNLKISLCEIFRNRASNPLGIYITSSGLNGKTFLDIYGGVEATSTAGNSGGLAKPNVRIGNLSGIPSFTISGGDTVSPSGWGIFTTNGYFEGAIVSDVGNIGGWNLTTDSIWKGNSNFGNASGMYFGASGISLGSTFKVTNAGVLTTTSGTISGFQIDGTSIRTNGVAVTSNADNSISLSSTDFTRTINSVSRSGLRFAMGDKFGVTGDGSIYASNVDLTGKITATDGSIGGWSIGTNGIYNGITGITTSGSTVGTFIGTGGISNYQNSSTYVNIQNGVITAKGASFLTATIGEATNKMIIGNGTNNQQSAIKYGMTGLDDTTNDGFYIGTDGIALGKGAFKVTKEGALTATSGSISGGIITTGINADNISTGTLAAARIAGGSLAIGKLDTTAQNTIANAAKTASDYITAIDSNGIWVTPSNLKPANTSTGAGATGTKINASGMEIFKSGSSVASYGDVVRIGETEQSRIEIDFHSLQLKDKEGDPYLYVSDLRNASGVAENVQESFIGNGTNRYFNLFGGSGIRSISSITIDGTATSAYTRNNPDQIVFNSAPADGAEIVVTYTTTSPRAKVYTFGQRLSDTNVKGLYSYAEGYNTTASGTVSHAEGWGIIASGRVSHAEGLNTIASGSYSHAEGSDTTASGSYSHAEGYHTTASRSYSHAEGNNTTASGLSSHTEGYHTTASHSYSHAEGDNSKAKGYGSHAEGFSAEARGNYSHAEGDHTLASGISSHAEGNAIAEGDYSHAEGMAARAGGYCSHAGGYNTIATASYSTVIGKYNANTASVVNGEIVYDAGDYAFIIGNGTDDSYSNALTVDWDGNVKAAGHVSGTSEQLTITRTSNSYVNDTSAALLKAVRKDGMLWFNGNVQLSSAVPNGTGLTEIAKITGWSSAYTVSATMAGQTGGGAILVTINTTGSVQIANGSGASATGFHRCPMVTPANN